MGTALTSIDTMLTQAQAQGLFTRFLISSITAATTAATTTSGYITAQRHPRSLTMPSLGTGVTGGYFMLARFTSEDATTGTIFAIEYDLGTLTVVGNSFADGVAMPTKTVKGLSLQTATQLAFLVVTTAITAISGPVITLTYTDQAGNTGNSAALTLSTAVAVNSAFLINPHLAAGDTGIRDITNMSINTGSAGVVSVRGLLLLSYAAVGGNITMSSVDPMTVPLIPWKAEASEVLAFYRTGSTTTNDILALISALADN